MPHGGGKAAWAELVGPEAGLRPETPIAEWLDVPTVHAQDDLTFFLLWLTLGAVS